MAVALNKTGRGWKNFVYIFLFFFFVFCGVGVAKTSGVELSRSIEKTEQTEQNEKWINTS